MPHELEALTDRQKCQMVFRAVCEGKDCELSFSELEALRDNGFITDLTRVSKTRWSFEWTDKLEAYAKATEPERAAIVADCMDEPELEVRCNHGILWGHCPDCPTLDDQARR